MTTKENSIQKRLQVSRYNMKEMIGEGGMGVIYRADDPVMKRDVAIKAVKNKQPTKSSSALVTPVETDMSPQWEAIITGRLSHPNIVNVYDVFKDDHYTYIIMEYVNGINVQKFFIDEKILLNKALEIFIQICDAIEFAHSQGIIHKDIKPSNILIRDDYRIKVVDFGISEFTSKQHENPAFSKDIFVGTPAYTTPEVLKQQSLDERTDIFALGIVFYELITGEHPFSGKSPYHQLYKILSVEPTPPSEIVPELHKAWDYILERALKKNRDLRYASVKELKKDLVNFDALDYYLKQEHKLKSDKIAKKHHLETVEILSKGLILVVDDDEDIISILTTVLQSKGYRIEEASDGAEALEILQNETPDVIISDIEMPIMDGWEFCVRVRQNEKFSKTPFIFLTGQKSPSDRVRGFEVGADDYIVKPFHPKELVMRIEAVRKRSHISYEKESQELSSQYSLPQMKADIHKSTTRDIKTVVGDTCQKMTEFFEVLGDPNKIKMSVKDFWTLKAHLNSLGQEKCDVLMTYVEPMIKSARSLLSKLQCEEAYSLLELVLMINPRDEQANILFDKCRKILYEYYDRKLRPFTQKPVLVSSSLNLEQIKTPDVAFLLSRIDGQTSIADIFRMTFNRMNTMRNLFLLKKAGYVSFN